MPAAPANEIEFNKNWLPVLNRPGHAVWEWDIATDVLKVSPEFNNIIKVNKDLINNVYPIKFWESQIKPEYLNTRLENLRKHFNQETEFYETELELLSTDGSKKWIREEGIIIESTQDKLPLKMVGSITDITKRKEEELSYIQNTRKWGEQIYILEKFKQAVAYAYDHIIITDPNGIIVYCNNAAEKLTGYTFQEMIGSTPALWGNQMSKEFYENMWNTILTKKSTFIGEFKNKRKTGEFYTVLVTISPVLDANNNVVFFIGIERDITKEKEVDRMKSEFISIVSHQLRTPLTSLKWNLEILKDPKLKLNEQEKDKSIDNAIKANENIIELVNNLLDISKLEAGRLVLTKTPTKIEDLVNTAVAYYKDITAKKQITLNTTFEKDLPEIIVDPRLTYEIYSNLISNAVKYTPKGGNVNIKIYIKQQQLCTEITDSGVGIPLKDQNKIFEKFYRADNAKRQFADGSGLGLYFVKSVIESHGGTITFESVENKGSTFRFTLPY